MILRVVVGALGLVVLSCGFSSGSHEDPYRCFHEVSLQKLIDAEGVSQDQPSGWGISSVEESSLNRFFDGEQEAVLSLDTPGLFVEKLCSRLRPQLADRCNITEFWAGTDYCAAVVQSPRDAVTGAGGIYK